MLMSWATTQDDHCIEVASPEAADGDPPADPQPPSTMPTAAIVMSPRIVTGEL